MGWGVPASAAGAVYTGTVDNDASTTAAKSSVFTHSVDAAGSLDLVLDWTDPRADLTLMVKNSSGTLLGTAATTQNPERLRVALPAAGSYKLNVIAKTGGSPYTLTAAASLEAATRTPVLERTIGGPARADVAPSGLDVDPDGNIYAASTGNDEIVKYGPDGGVLWRKGKRTGTKAAGTFFNPRDTAYLAGRVYVADTGNNRIQVLDAATGDWVATWPHRFAALLGVSAGVDAGGNAIILASDSTAHRVNVYTPDSTFVRKIGAGTLGTADGSFNQVRDAATDAAGNVYVADFKNQRVQKFTAGGTFLLKWGVSCLGLCPAPQPGQFKEPYGIQVDQQGAVYVSDNRRVQQFTGTGAYLQQYGTAGEGPDELFMLRRVAVGPGPKPDVYAADLWGYKIHRYDQDGTLERTFGGDTPPHTGFNQPYGLSAKGDELFVADTNNQRIEVYSASSGTFLRSFGKRGYGATNLNGVNWPRGVTYNAGTDTVWVADTKNYRMVERDVAGVPTGRVFGSTGKTLLPGVLNWVYGTASVGSDVVVADTFGNKIGRWTGNDPDTPVWTYTGVKSPKAVVVAGDVVYVADSVNTRVVRLRADTGALIDVLDDPGLGRVEGIAVTADGRIFAADAARNKIFEFSASGQVVQTFGSGLTTPSQLLVMGTGAGQRLYVADTNNDRVQVYDIS